MKLTKDLLLESMCMIETYRQLFQDYGYEPETVEEMINRLDENLGKVYVLMCDKKWHFEDIK